jgi:hypothetical protein
LATPDEESVIKGAQVMIPQRYLIQYNAIHNPVIIIHLTHSFLPITSASTGNRFSHPEGEGLCVPQKHHNKAS